MNKKRWNDILDQLSETEMVTSESLAQKLNLSSRTIRNEMKELKAVLEQVGAHLVSKTSTGYLLQIEDQKKYGEFLSTLKDQGDIPETSKERVQYLLETLLANNDQYVKLEDLSDQIYVSRSSLTNDLKEVRQMLKEYNLKLITRPGYGIKVEGREFDLRLCIAASTIGRIEKKSNCQENSLRKIADCIQLGLQDTPLHISEVSYHNLIVHIYIALQRINDDCHVPLEAKQLKMIKKEAEFVDAKRIAALLEETFVITIPETEIGYIAIHLASKRIIEASEVQDNVVIDQKINDVVKHMLDVIEKNYNLRFHEDLELRMVLAMHLIPFAVRMQYDMNLKNPLLKEIKTRYTLAYMIAISACEVLKEVYHKQIQEDEIGYFALHFNLALERRKHQGTKKNILIVCSTGRGSAQMLVYRMQEEFGKYLDHIVTCDVLQVEQYDFRNIDYVITTVPIPYSVPRPILQIQLFLEEQDIKAIRSLLNGENTSSLQQYFHPDLFLSNLEVETKEEAIEAIVKRIHQVKSIPDDFLEAVFAREKMAVTAFGNRVAIPHPNRAMSEETFVCVAVLKKPIDWNRQKVQFIFMLSLTTAKDKNMEQFSRITSKLLFSQEYINEIIKSPKYSTLMKLLGNIEKEMGEKNG